MRTAISIANEVYESGGRAYLVGGVVRDMILGHESKDIDIEIFNMQPEVLEAILPKHGEVKFCGKSFGVYKIGNIDISLPRTERKTGAGYKGFTVSVDPNMSMYEAARRRDLTINAIMYCPITKQFHDPHNGIDDIRNKVIRHIASDTFVEDPLRVLRVAQFSARLGFDVHPDTIELCSVILHEIPMLSKERVMQELEKMLLRAERPSIAFRVMYDIGVLDILLPELAVLKGIDQGTKHHDEDVFEHTMMVIDAIPKQDRTLEIMFAALLHDIGKATVVAEHDDGAVHFYGHAEEGYDMAKDVVSRFTDEVELIVGAANLVKHHMHLYSIVKEPHKRLVRRLATKVDMDKLLKLHRADKLGRGPSIVPNIEHIVMLTALWESVRDEIKPLIKGQHLIDVFGLTPSKKFGVILRAMFDLQLEGEFDTVEGGIEILNKLIGDYR